MSFETTKVGLIITLQTIFSALENPSIADTIVFQTMIPDQEELPFFKADEFRVFGRRKTNFSQTF